MCKRPERNTAASCGLRAWQANFQYGNCRLTISTSATVKAVTLISYITRHQQSYARCSRIRWAANATWRHLSNELSFLDRTGIVQKVAFAFRKNCARQEKLRFNIRRASFLYSSYRVQVDNARCKKQFDEHSVHCKKPHLHLVVHFRTCLVEAQGCSLTTSTCWRIRTFDVFEVKYFSKALNKACLYILWSQSKSVYYR